jgi:peptidoglycan/xylan/chitin deacetylase (PgdA/CDA1 family)
MTATGRLPILTFHTLDDRPAVCALPPRVFRHGIARLRARGFEAIALEAVADRVRRGLDLPPTAVVITFDDGYRTVYDEAFPVLQDAGMTATVFLTVGPRTAPGDRLPSLEGRPMLSWPEIREMQRAGFAFGAHTLTHPDLTRLAAPDVETEMRVEGAARGSPRDGRSVLRLSLRPLRRAEPRARARPLLLRLLRRAGARRGPQRSVGARARRHVLPPHRPALRRRAQALAAALPPRAERAAPPPAVVFGQTGGIGGSGLPIMCQFT